MASDRTSDSAEEMAADVAAFLADRYGATELVAATELVGKARAQVLAAQIRSNALRIAAAEAEQLSLVAQFTSLVEAQAVAELAASPRVPVRHRMRKWSRRRWSGSCRWCSGSGPARPVG